MSPALNGSSAIRRFKHSEAIEIRDGITFDLYTGLLHIVVSKFWQQPYMVGGAYERDKNTSVRLCAKMQGGRICGTLRYYLKMDSYI